MGLCKCPKKRVTNQFCFEHRVNVCEHCLVTNHPKCVVQSYLKWLQDSDYETTCQLCKKDLVAEDCIRLQCYHVFHWGCLDKFARQFPAETAPAGFTCPSCSTNLFPSANTTSPVADKLRQVMSRANWARAGLGLPMIDETQQASTGQELPFKFQQPELFPQMSAPALLGTHLPHSPPHFASPNLNMYMGTDRYSSQVPQMSSTSSSPIFTSVAFTSPRKLYDTTEKGSLYRPFVDHDEDKYKRRSALDWFTRWFKSHTSVGRHSHFHSSRPDSRLFYRQWFLLGLLIFLGLCTLVLIFVRLGRGTADADPFLNPHLNPNIRVDNSISMAQSPDGLVARRSGGLVAVQGLNVFGNRKEQRL